MEDHSEFYEADMHTEIYKGLKAAGIPRPSTNQVRAKINKYRQDDLTKFSYESGLRNVMKEIVTDFVDDFKKKQHRGDTSFGASGDATETEGRLSKNGHPVSYPTGYEYAILVASRIEPQARQMRETLKFPGGKPFTDFDEAVAFMNTLHNDPVTEIDVETPWSTVSLKMPPEKAAELKKYVVSDRESPNSGVDIDTLFDKEELSLENFIDIFKDLKSLDVEIVDAPAFSLALIPKDDLNEEHTVTWSLLRNRRSSQVFITCYGLVKAVPEWDVNKLFSYVFLGRLPLLPVQANYRVAQKKGGGKTELLDFTLTIPFPMDDATLLRLYKKLRDAQNDPASRRYNFDPPNVSEYELILIDLVFQMPLAEFVWSARLDKYFKENAKEIRRGLLPDLGLRKTNGHKDRNNATRNMARDYRRLLAKLK